MPIYEYVCEHCDHELEKIQKLNDPALTDCPACGQPTLKKKISAAGFRLKGGGWYETDFKKGNQKNLHESSSGKTETKAADSPAASSTAGSDKTATPAKPATSTSTV